MVWDVDGNGYIDYCGSWGALILGHAHPKVVQAAVEQVQMSSSFGMATGVEAEIAAQIIKHAPSIEKIRFVSSGTEAGMSVVRVARGFTGRSHVLKFDGNYHGHFDSFLIRAGSGVSYLNESSSKGIPADFVKYTASLPYNDIETVRAYIRSEPDLAAVMLEPVAGNMGVVPATEAFVQMLREETRKTGALLVFDEVITGFRVGLKSAQGLYGVVPDLSCFGKIIGGGFPAAAFGGRKEIMECLAPLGQVYQAGTLSGNPVAMKAGLAALQELEAPGLYEELERKTNIITEPLREAGLKVNQVGSMFTIFLGNEKYRELFVYLFERGIYLPPSQYEACFVSTAHTEGHLKETRDAIVQFLL
jgi:glutamate-1-semialdehyde 2,1-aminomutase